MIKIIKAETAELLRAAKKLFLEYADSLEFSLDFQDFDEELADFPGAYEEPTGALLIAIEDERPIGCVALRRFDEDVSEMKRLYVRPAYHGRGLGRTLAEAIVSEAKKLGYKKMLLDTVPSMKAAQGLYLSMGFREIPPYRVNPIPGACYMELELE
jgi:ribosomal protein S18 acetylase RimI-like enzyme